MELVGYRLAAMRKRDGRVMNMDSKANGDMTSFPTVHHTLFQSTCTIVIGGQSESGTNEIAT